MPKVVAVVPLAADCSTDRFVAFAAQQLEARGSAQQFWNAAAKQRLQFLGADGGGRTLFQLLDACLAADFVVFLLSASCAPDFTDAAGAQLVQLLRTHGLPTPLFVVQNQRKDMRAARDQLLAVARATNPESERVYCQDAADDARLLLRHIAQHLPRAGAWRSSHAFVLADSVRVVQSGEGACDVHVTGFVRGRPLIGNSRVYIPSAGRDFFVREVRSQQAARHSEMAAEAVVQPAEPAAEDAEMADLPEDSGSGSASDGESFSSEAFPDCDDEAERRALKETLCDDPRFADHVDVPKGSLASELFASFRHVASLRHTAWSLTENLPAAYASLCAFRNYQQAQRTAAAVAGTSFAVGTRVEVCLAGVPPEAAASLSAQILLVELLQHEHRETVVHASVMRSFGFQEQVRGGDPLIAVAGFRRFSVRPVYSESTAGAAHRMQRFLEHEPVPSVATFYAPASMVLGPVLLLSPSERSSGVPCVVATGTLLPPDPDRVVAERITLSGWPFKVHKRSAVVRFMFHHPDDVRYHQPVALATKNGRSGKIIGSLGTHGYMKCRFDRQVQQNDLVMMHLYRRVFPHAGSTAHLPSGGL